MPCVKRHMETTPIHQWKHLKVTFVSNTSSFLNRSQRNGKCQLVLFSHGMEVPFTIVAATPGQVNQPFAFLSCFSAYICYHSRCTSNGCSAGRGLSVARARVKWICGYKCLDTWSVFFCTLDLLCVLVLADMTTAYAHRSRKTIFFFLQTLIIYSTLSFGATHKSITHICFLFQQWKQDFRSTYIYKSFAFWKGPCALVFSKTREFQLASPTANYLWHGLHFERSIHHITCEDTIQVCGHIVAALSHIPAPSFTSHVM